MTDVKKTYRMAIPIRLARADKVGEVGKFTTEVGKKIGTAITTQFAQDPDDYNIDIVITMEANQL